MICITIQRTLSVAKVRYLIGDKECFKIFYPRFFAWTNLFLLNHILLYSLLFPFQSIQTYVARVPVFWMVYFVCIFSSFRVFCIKGSRRRRKTVLVPQTNFLRLWHGKKNPWRYALKYFKTILPGLFFVCRADNGWLLYKTHERMRICKRNRPFKKQKPLPHKFEWIEMAIAKNRE